MSEIMVCGTPESQGKMATPERWATRVRLTAWSFQTVTHSPVKPKRDGHLCPHRELFSNIHGSFICHSQNVARTQEPINRWPHKQTAEYLQRREERTNAGTHYNMRQSRSKHATCKKLDPQNGTRCMCPFIEDFRKGRVIHRDGKQISGGLGWGQRGRGNFW